MSKITIVGIGNLILDYYFYDNKIYVNGGGTVSNILANLSNMGMDTKLVGYYGNNYVGEVAKKLLEKTGVNTSLLERKDYKTKCFFINSEGYSSTCPYCNTKTKNYKLRTDIDKFIQKEDIILIQDYTVLNNNSNKVCLDFGYFKKLIFEDNKKIEEFIFKSYYIVTIKETALSFILKKLNITFEQFIQRSSIYFLIITKGKNGATIVYNHKKYEYHIDPLEEKETNGCGDIFFATFIYEIIKRKNLTKKDIDEIFCLAQKNVSTVLNNIGARNHIVSNLVIKKSNKCICEDFIIQN